MSLTFISYADPTIPSNDTISGTYVRHPQGQLQSIFYQDHFGAPTLEEGHRIQKIMQPYALEDSYGFQNLFVCEDDNCTAPLHDDHNWSTIDVGAPYHLCSVCDLAVVNDTEICSICAYVRAYSWMI